jgi:hypothetical protein
MTSILESPPVVVGGAVSTPTGDVHSDVSKPPLTTNTVATLTIVEDRDSQLVYNRNSDTSQSWKLTGQGLGFAGGFATRILFGTDYKNDKGEYVAPKVHVTSDNGVSATIQNVTSQGFDLSCTNIGAGAIGRVRITVLQPT